jgi:hypothetical protein
MAKDTSRGFNALKGVTIKAVSASCVNSVMLLGDGWIYTIDAEIENGIPVMRVKKHKEKFIPLPDTRPLKLLPKEKPKKQRPVLSPMAAWPYPQHSKEAAKYDADHPIKKRKKKD